MLDIITGIIELIMMPFSIGIWLLKRRCAKQLMAELLQQDPELLRDGRWFSVVYHGRECSQSFTKIKDDDAEGYIAIIGGCLKYWSISVEGARLKFETDLKDCNIELTEKVAAIIFGTPMVMVEANGQCHYFRAVPKKLVISPDAHTRLLFKQLFDLRKLS